MKVSMNTIQWNKQVAAVVQRAVATGRDVHKLAEETLGVLARKLEEETVKRMPVDEGFLEKSIDHRVEKAGIFTDTTGVVWIPTNSPAAEYAMFMHELIYNLGGRSAAKQAGQTEVVGRKYMERAMDENARAFSLYIIKEFKEFIGA